MTRLTFSNLAFSGALATSLVFVSAACKSTTAAGPESEEVPAEATDSMPAVVFESVPAESAEDSADSSSKDQAEFSTQPGSTQPGDELDDYYRKDSRDNIQKMESQLKPLGVVQPDKPPTG